MTRAEVTMKHRSPGSDHDQAIRAGSVCSSKTQSPSSKVLQAGSDHGGTAAEHNCRSGRSLYAMVTVHNCSSKACLVGGLKSLRQTPWRDPVSQITVLTRFANF
jgi:hypothetical protein